MNVILLKDVEKLGLKGDVVDVKRGYARNFLLPRNLAEVATEGRVKEVKRIDAQKAMHEARSTEQANEIAETLGKLVLRFDVKSGPTGSPPSAKRRNKTVRPARTAARRAVSATGRFAGPERPRGLQFAPV